MARAVQAAPGVGPKLAQRVILELKSKAAGVMAQGVSLSSVAVAGEDDVIEAAAPVAARKAAKERSPQETERLARQWASENQGVIDSMNQHYEAVGSMGRRMYEWRKKQAALADTASAPVSDRQRRV